MHFGVESALCFILLYSGISNNYITAPKKKEAIAVGLILTASRTNNIKTVVTQHNSYNKLYIQFDENIKAGDIILTSLGNESQFPPTPFLLVGSRVKTKSVYMSKKYRNHRSKILFERNV